MKNVGILAYGSLIDSPGKEIEAAIDSKIENVQTPFKIEFAHSSENRNGAPTLVPVENGGANTLAQIIILKEGISERDATDMLWRRETHQVGSGKEYTCPVETKENAVFIEKIESFHNLAVVLYTRIVADISSLTPEELARKAIESALSESGDLGVDGVSYLNHAKTQGIQTPLMSEYEKAILNKLSAKNLDDAMDILRIERLKKQGKIPKKAEILSSPPTAKDAGKLVIFSATIGKTYIKLSPPIALVSEYRGGKRLNSYNTVFLDLNAQVENSYLYVSFPRKTNLEDVLDYFNNLMALFNIISIPLDFVTPSDILVRAKGLGTTIEFISSSKAHARGYGMQPVEISNADFTQIDAVILSLWNRIKSSKHFEHDNFFQLLGYAQYYLFYGIYFLSFIHAWIFLESCVNLLWSSLIDSAFHDVGVSKNTSPMADERNWTTQIKIDELFLKKIIDKEMRDSLQSLRAKRNKVFHRERQLQKRLVTEEDARKATVTGLKLFYMMIGSKLGDRVIAFNDINKKIWETMNRGNLHKTEILEKAGSDL
ncbi:hypothetical protein MUP01_04945 [Candidatus Bathyarchaeota archaeon]|nr:hypothetical protein [Candidatus Bathyarchaeota archaeon]